LVIIQYLILPFVLNKVEIAKPQVTIKYRDHLLDPSDTTSMGVIRGDTLEWPQYDEFGEEKVPNTESRRLQSEAAEKNAILKYDMGFHKVSTIEKILNEMAPSFYPKFNEEELSQPKILRQLETDQISARICPCAQAWQTCNPINEKTSTDQYYICDTGEESHQCKAACASSAETVCRVKYSMCPLFTKVINGTINYPSFLYNKTSQRTFELLQADDGELMCAAHTYKSILMRKIPNWTFLRSEWTKVDYTGDHYELEMENGRKLKVQNEDVQKMELFDLIGEDTVFTLSKYLKKIEDLGEDKIKEKWTNDQRAHLSGALSYLWSKSEPVSSKFVENTQACQKYCEQTDECIGFTITLYGHSLSKEETIEAINFQKKTHLAVEKDLHWKTWDLKKPYTWDDMMKYSFLDYKNGVGTCVLLREFLPGCTRGEYMNQVVYLELKANPIQGSGQPQSSSCIPYQTMNFEKLPNTDIDFFDGSLKFKDFCPTNAQWENTISKVRRKVNQFNAKDRKYWDAIQEGTDGPYCPVTVESSYAFDSGVPITFRKCSRKAQGLAPPPGSLELLTIVLRIFQIPYSKLTSGTATTSAREIGMNFQDALAYALEFKGPIPVGTVVSCKFSVGAAVGTKKPTIATCMLNANRFHVEAVTDCGSAYPERGCPDSDKFAIRIEQQLLGNGAPFKDYLPRISFNNIKNYVVMEMYSFKKIGKYDMVKTDVECEGLGFLLCSDCSISECAAGCHASSSCIYFTYGKRFQSRDCWAQTGDGCKDRRYMKADADLYKLGTQCPDFKQKNICESYGCQWVLGNCRWTPVHGNWADWAEWEMCKDVSGTFEGKERLCTPSQSTGIYNARQSRTRKCINPAPKHGGNNCLGMRNELRTCAKNLCEKTPVWGDWQAWGQCSIACMGKSTRIRKYGWTREVKGGVDVYTDRVVKSIEMTETYKEIESKNPAAKIVQKETTWCNYLYNVKMDTDCEARPMERCVQSPFCDWKTSYEGSKLTEKCEANKVGASVRTEKGGTAKYATITKAYKKKTDCYKEAQKTKCFATMKPKKPPGMNSKYTCGNPPKCKPPTVLWTVVKDDQSGECPAGQGLGICADPGGELVDWIAGVQTAEMGKQLANSINFEDLSRSTGDFIHIFMDYRTKLFDERAYCMAQLREYKHPDNPLSFNFLTFQTVFYARALDNRDSLCIAFNDRWNDLTDAEQGEKFKTGDWTQGNYIANHRDYRLNHYQWYYSFRAEGTCSGGQWLYGNYEAGDKYDCSRSRTKRDCETFSEEQTKVWLKNSLDDAKKSDPAEGGGMSNKKNQAKPACKWRVDRLIQTGRQKTCFWGLQEGPEQNDPKDWRNCGKELYVTSGTAPIKTEAPRGHWLFLCCPRKVTT